MADEYFYLKFGIPRGPFSWPEFVELAKNRKVTSKTKCIVNDTPSVAATVLFGKHWPQIDKIQQAANEAERRLLDEKRAKRIAERQAKKEKSEKKKVAKKHLADRQMEIAALKKQVTAKPSLLAQSANTSAPTQTIEYTNGMQIPSFA